MGRQNPFERILSMIERRKIFTYLIKNKSPIVLKLADGKMLVFQGQQLSNESHIDGLLKDGSLGKSRQRQVVAFFYYGKDRYFLNTKILLTASGYYRLFNTKDFYKLNRRDSYRITIPDGITLTLLITSVAQIACRAQVRLHDFSSGGARMRWTSSLALPRGCPIKGTLFWLRGKEIPVHAIVKHKTREGLYGIQFTQLDAVQMNRLRFLSIELQQLINYLKS